MTTLQAGDGPARIYPESDGETPEPDAYAYHLSYADMLQAPEPEPEPDGHS